VTTYPIQPEVILTAAQVRIMARLLVVLNLEQIEQLTEAIEDICEHGQGIASVKIYRGHGRFIDRTYTDNMSG
jgi:hypothetical protein